MSPTAPRGASVDELKAVSSKLDTLSSDVSVMKATSAAETASLRAGQEHLRSDLIERDTRTRKDIHDQYGKLDELNGKLYNFKEELKDDFGRKFEELGKTLGDKLSAQVEKQASQSWVPRLVEAIVIAVILAVITAVINHKA